VAELLGDRRTTFLVVTSPQRDSIDEAVFFRRRLREGGMPFGGAIVNRVHDQELAADDSDDIEDDLVGLLGDKLAAKVVRNYEDYRELAQRDGEQIDRLRRDTRDGAVVLVPYLDDDVHDADGLRAMNAHLFAPDTVSA